MYTVKVQPQKSWQSLFVFLNLNQETFQLYFSYMSPITQKSNQWTKIIAKNMTNQKSIDKPMHLFQGSKLLAPFELSRFKFTLIIQIIVQTLYKIPMPITMTSVIHKVF